MINARALAAEDLAHTLEGEFGVAVTFIAPDGSKISTSIDGLPLKGRVLYSQTRVNIETGERANVPEPLVILRRASLSRVPETGENWGVIIPTAPGSSQNTLCFLDGSQAIGGGESLGFIRLPLMRAAQKATA